MQGRCKATRRDSTPHRTSARPVERVLSLALKRSAEKEAHPMSKLGHLANRAQAAGKVAETTEADRAATRIGLSCADRGTPDSPAAREMSRSGPRVRHLPAPSRRSAVTGNVPPTRFPVRQTDLRD